MGVFGSFCQICGMPLQHNCYVRDPNDARLARIYRGPESQGMDPPPFLDPVAHAWLLHVVALRTSPSEEPQVYTTRAGVQDGDLTLEDGQTVDVELGDGDRFGLHDCCWRLAGCVERDVLVHIANGEAWKDIQAKFHAQLFDFERLVEEGCAWMLACPDAQTGDGRRNRVRIETILAASSPAARSL